MSFTRRTFAKVLLFTAAGYGSSNRKRGWDAPVQFIYANHDQTIPKVIRPGDRVTIAWRASRYGEQYGDFIAMRAGEGDFENVYETMTSLRSQAADCLRTLQERGKP